MDPKHFFAELKRRNVYKVSVAYAVIAWLLVQVASVLFAAFEAPSWVMQAFVTVIATGFLVALVIAWAFEMTPQGMKRTEEISPNESIPSWSRRKFAALIVTVALLACGLFLLQFTHWNPASLLGRRLGWAGTSEKSIAVLPFASLSEDKANEYFAEGIQDEILTRLAQISDLQVISRTSTLRYKSAPANLSEIAKELGVAHILEGSVQKSGDRVRIIVQLINAQTDRHLWAETYDRTLTDVFAVQSELAQRVADSLRATLTGAEKATLDARPTENPAAYDAYLRGLAVMASNRETTTAFKDAADFFDSAVALDPKFALAWARASIAQSRLNWSGYDRSAAGAEKARHAAEKAQELRPDLGEGFLARGYYEYLVAHDYDAAMATFREAVARLPNNADALTALSFIERRKGKWSESLANQERAARLDPQNLPVLTQLGITYFAVKRFADAHAIVDRLLALSPENPQVLAGLARLHLAEGNLAAAEADLRAVPPAPNNNYIFEIQVRLALIARRYGDAITVLENALAQPPSTSELFAGKYRYLLGFSKQLSGKTDGARPIFEEARADLEKLMQAQPDSPEAQMYLAFVEAALGNKESALRAGQKAIDLRPATMDVVANAAFAEGLARVKAQLGETDAAVAELERLLKVNYIGPEQIALTRALLRLDPIWDPLRSNPQFQQLSGASKP